MAQLGYVRLPISSAQVSFVANPEYPHSKVRLPVKPASHVYTIVLPWASLAPSVPDANVAALVWTNDVPSQVTPTQCREDQN